MSADNTFVESNTAPESPEMPPLLQSASYMGCRYCEEGSLVYDEVAEASRCRTCGRLD